MAGFGVDSGDGELLLGKAKSGGDVGEVFDGEGGRRPEASIWTPRLRMAFLPKPSAENMAAAVTGRRRMTKVRIFPMERRERP